MCVWALSRPYLPNHSTICNQTWNGCTASWAGVSCKMIGLLSSRSSRLKCCFTSTETVGLLGTGAQEVHLDLHTAPEERWGAMRAYIMITWLLFFYTSPAIPTCPQPPTPCHFHHKRDRQTDRQTETDRQRRGRKALKPFHYLCTEDCPCQTGAVSIVHVTLKCIVHVTLKWLSLLPIIWS